MMCSDASAKPSTDSQTDPPRHAMCLGYKSVVGAPHPEVTGSGILGDFK